VITELSEINKKKEKVGDRVKERLQPFQLSILIFMIQNGLVLYTAPRVTAEYFGTNGWLSIIFIFIFVNINIVLITIIYKLGKGRSIFEIIEATVPKWVMMPFYLFIIGIWIGMASMIMKKYIIIFKMMFFSEFSVIVFIICFMILSFQLLRGGIYNITKAIFVLFFFVIPMLFLLVYIFPEFDFARLTPYFFKGKTDFFKGTFQVYSGFLGIEVALLFFPMVEGKWTKALYLGNFFSMANGLIITLSCYGFFSFKQILNDLYPVMTLFEYTEVQFISRAENLCFSVYAFKVLSTMVIYYWGAQQIFRNMNKNVKPNFWIFIILASSFILALIPDSIVNVEKWLELLSYCAIGIAWTLPMFVLFILIIQFFQRLSSREISRA